MASLIIHSMESCKDINSHGSIDGLLGGMLRGKEYGTILGSAVIVVCDELNISEVELVIWVFNCLLLNIQIF